MIMTRMQCMCFFFFTFKAHMRQGEEKLHTRASKLLIVYDCASVCAFMCSAVDYHPIQSVAQP